MGAVRVTGLNVIASHVTNMERSLHFYLNVLGFQAGEKMGPGQIVKAGELMIYLEPGTGKGVADPKGRSGFSPCLAVDSVKQSYDRLVETGVTILEPYREFAPDFGFFRLADPDGFAIEIAGHP